MTSRFILAGFLTIFCIQFCVVQSGYCNWGPQGDAASSVCDGQVQGGEWCNESQERCETCGGKWCTNDGTDGVRPTPLSTPPPQPGSGNIATTTRYWDCSGGACGCAYLPEQLGGDTNKPAHCYSNALFSAPQGNEYGAKFYGAAAISEELGGGNWLAEGCGKCWKVTGTSNAGSYAGVSTTLVLKGTNFCPPSNAACNGKAHFDIAAPGFDVIAFSQSNTCAEVEPEETSGFQSCGEWMINSQNPDNNCNCDLFENEVLKRGCKNFYSLKWDNPTVTYEEVSCPKELADLPCWEENGNQYPSVIPQLCANPNANSASNPPSTAPPTNSPPTTNPPSTTNPPPTTNPPSAAPPTNSPPTNPPPTTNPPSTGSGSFCCTSNFKDCQTGWCNENQGNCEGSCGGFWMDVSNNVDCIARWGDCTSNTNGCCSPGSCQGDSTYKQCSYAA